MTNERLAELIPHIESALEDGYPLQLKGDDLRFLLEAIKARLSHEPSEVLRCTCVWFAREGATVTQHWRDDPLCPVHAQGIKAATQGLTLTGLPEKSNPPLQKMEHGPYDEVYFEGLKWLDENG